NFVLPTGEGTKLSVAFPPGKDSARDRLPALGRNNLRAKIAGQCGFRSLAATECAPGVKRAPAPVAVEDFAGAPRSNCDRRRQRQRARWTFLARCRSSSCARGSVRARSVSSLHGLPRRELARDSTGADRTGCA